MCVVITIWCIQIMCLQLVHSSLRGSGISQGWYTSIIYVPDWGTGTYRCNCELMNFIQGLAVGQRVCAGIHAHCVPWAPWGDEGAGDWAAPRGRQRHLTSAKINQVELKVRSRQAGFGERDVQLSVVIVESGEACTTCLSLDSKAITIPHRH